MQHSSSFTKKKTIIINQPWYNFSTSLCCQFVCLFVLGLFHFEWRFTIIIHWMSYLDTQLVCPRCECTFYTVCVCGDDEHTKPVLACAWVFGGIYREFWELTNEQKKGSFAANTIVFYIRAIAFGCVCYDSIANWCEWISKCTHTFTHMWPMVDA